MNGYREIDIVLVEDDPNDVELTIRALKKHNLANNIVHLKDGAEALDFLFGPDTFVKEDNINKPKVILLDLKLPKVNGIEVLQRIKSDEQARKIPVVILTSSREDIDLQAAYDLGVNSYVCKPINYEEFSKVVTELGMYWLLLNKSVAK